MRFIHTWSTTPRAVYRRAATVMVASGAAALAVLAAWATPNAGLPNTRLVMAFYLTLLLLAVGAGCVALLSACQIAIHQAFSAGFQTGQVAHVDPIHRAEAAAKRGDTDPVVKLVT